MRWFALCLVAWAGCAGAQRFMPNDTFLIPDDLMHRLEIQLVPVYVLDSDTLVDVLDDEALIEEIVLEISEEVTPMFDNVRRALEALGITFGRYNISLGDRFEFIECFRSRSSIGNVLPQDCWHGETGIISDWPNFVQDLYDGANPSQRIVQLNILILQDGLPWTEVIGYTWRWWWGADQKHWTTSACRIWSLNELPVIAHELGHCFGLAHNEDEPFGYGADLMRSNPGYFDFLNELNSENVENYFRHPPPEISILGVRPQVELHH